MHFIQAIIPEHVIGVDIPVPDAVIGGFKNGRVALFASLQDFFGEFAIANVDAATGSTPSSISWSGAPSACSISC